jgi:hypothetical protein
MKIPPLSGDTYEMSIPSMCFSSVGALDHVKNNENNVMKAVKLATHQYSVVLDD